MDYERFKEGFQDALKAELAVRGADVELTARRVDKMNESYDAITVRPTDSSIGVNISVEKAFASYENGTPIPEIAERFADAVEKGFRESPQVDLESLSDYEQMKSKLSMEVVSAEKNAELLESVPHERMEDMAVVYRFVLDQTDSGNGTILVTNQLLDQYGITKEQLRADAMENAPEIRPSEIRGMSEVMSRCLLLQFRIRFMELVLSHIRISWRMQLRRWAVTSLFFQAVFMRCCLSRTMAR